ncbi:MAG TPA: HEAT repeat domain-containing protein [Candidatus Acidoferrum sp.]
MIAIGQVRIVASIPTTMLLQNNSYSALDRSGNLTVDRILRPSGMESTRIVPMHWVVPRPRFDGPGYADVEDGTYMLFFFKKRPGEEVYEFASPYYPGLPVVANAPVRDGDLEDQIVDQVSNFLESSGGDSEKKSMLLMQLGDVRTPSFTRTLYRLFNGPEPHLHMTALFALLSRKEVDLIPGAEQEILHNSNYAHIWERKNLILALSQQFEASQSLPVLSKALRSPEIEIRQTAALALRYTHSSEAVGPLLAVVDDADSEVQWNAMHSLGELVNELEWRPNSKEPPVWQRCINHWHEFSLRWPVPLSEK